MFDILEDQIKKDEERETTKQSRMLQRAIIALLSVVLFGALYVGIHLIP